MPDIMSSDSADRVRTVPDSARQCPTVVSARQSPTEPTEPTVRAQAPIVRHSVHQSYNRDNRAVLRVVLLRVVGGSAPVKDRNHKLRMTRDGILAQGLEMVAREAVICDDVRDVHDGAGALAEAGGRRFLLSVVHSNRVLELLFVHNLLASVELALQDNLRNPLAVDHRSYRKQQ
eukprot:2248526-Prymnesium_polylepis.1